MNLELMKDGFPPVQYYEALDHAHTKEDYSLFLALIVEVIEQGFSPTGLPWVWLNS